MYKQVLFFIVFFSPKKICVASLYILSRNRKYLKCISIQ